MQSPPFPRYLVPPRSKYSPQHHVLKHFQLPFLPQCQRPSFTPKQTKGKIRVLYILIFKFWIATGRQRILHRMVASISWPQSALYYFRNRRFVKVVPKYLTSSTLSIVLLSILTLWIRPAFWSRDMTMYLVLPALASIYIIEQILIFICRGISSHYTRDLSRFYHS